MIESILREIRTHRSFLITTHENPDGDAVGSSLALAGYLKGLGKDVTIHFCDPVPELYRFLPLAGSVRHDLPDQDFDVCFVLDVGEFRRAGTLVNECRRIGMFINIDHHLTCDRFGTINYIDSAAAASGVLVYRIIKAAGHDIDYDTALALYTSIITDTGSFRYSNANPEAFAIAGELVATGINTWSIAEKLYESQPRQRLELLALALSTLSFSANGDCASITVTLDMYEKVGACAELTDGFVNYPRSIRGVEVAVFFREIQPQLFKVGFRSKGKIDVASLAAAFGGGGHHNAAGCTLTGGLAEVRKRVFDHLETAL
ncbi:MULTISPECIES: DHH family phosphoesterase [Geobacter]|uniref:Phosphoesterase n=2 Tax=Geobacter TaxID=28231 RepID=A0A0C1TSX8_9BACT|nr:MULTISPECIES: bifunctional oligoribonuclease/PAP phosphatase NrnA [Geobacter]ANA40415.1 phosphoesterase [Geobacter anodireducens]KIE42428.1 phosphoesterase [Geobacter soli]MBE2887146.1 bifunctional oligoribonuclease/PAP phosphatase NrnA [Geobacter anodireducens]HMN01279.1 bifunctional oligoribonuclease/PAP phosphatase NrnA [Geobacter anodireducens]